MKKILLLIPIIFLSGCFNYRELSDLAIITAVAIDFENDEFNTFVQVVNPHKEQDASSSEEPDFVTYEASGKTIQEAFRNIVNDSPSLLYGAHMQVLIISEDVATNHIDEILDFFARDPEIRTEFKVFVSESSNAKDELTIVTPLVNLPSMNIVESLETNIKYLGNSQDLTFNTFLNNYLNPYREITVPILKLKGDTSLGEKEENIEQSKVNAALILNNIAIFKENKLIGYLDEETSIGLNYILDNISGTIISYECEDGYLTSEIIKSKSSLEPDIKNNIVTLNIEGHATISEVTCNIDIRGSKVVQEVKKNINKKVEELVINSFNTIRNEYNTDVFNFRDLYYKTDPKYYNEHYKNWYEDGFKNLKLEVKSTYKLYEKGSTLGGIKHEKENN